MRQPNLTRHPGKCKGKKKENGLWRTKTETRGEGEMGGNGGVRGRWNGGRKMKTEEGGKMEDENEMKTKGLVQAHATALNSVYQYLPFCTPIALSTPSERERSKPEPKLQEKNKPEFESVQNVRAEQGAETVRPEGDVIDPSPDQITLIRRSPDQMALQSFKSLQPQDLSPWSVDELLYGGRYWTKPPWPCVIMHGHEWSWMVMDGHA
ncbi:hypothetical protein B0H11DRAFT_2371746 [Mycena galericulata]|nr:hypothetical protein B0H11DRAFT_2371746 [Mycena galericulata]